MAGPGGTYDVAVVGLGVLGSATAWQLARRGLSVVGLERFEFMHAHGSSHGDTRIVRLSYHTPNYVSAAIEAYTDWAALEVDAGRSLLMRTGGVDLFPPASVVDVEDYVNSMTVMAVPYEVLTATEAHDRWPGLTVPRGTTALYQDRAGIVPAGGTVRILHEQARRFGADLRDHHEVVELVDLGEGMALRTADGGRFAARKVVVTADAWTNTVLASLDARVPLTVTREQVIHFAVSDSDSYGLGGRHQPSAFPVWTWMDDPSFFGFPTWGEASVKVGQDCGGLPVDPDDRDPEVDQEALHRTTALMRVLVPGAEHVKRVTTGLYALPPDRDFVADLLPGQENVVVGLGAAHGFKFAPWFGRVLADLATTGHSTTDLSAFSLTRRGLTDPTAPLSWLL